VSEGRREGGREGGREGERERGACTFNAILPDTRGSVRIRHSVRCSREGGRER